MKSFILLKLKQKTFHLKASLNERYIRSAKNKRFKQIKQPGVVIH